MVVLPHSPCLSLPRVKGKGAFCNIRRPECCKPQRKTRILRVFSTPEKHKPHVPNVLCFNVRIPAHFPPFVNLTALQRLGNCLPYI